MQDRAENEDPFDAFDSAVASLDWSAAATASAVVTDLVLAEGRSEILLPIAKQIVMAADRARDQLDAESSQLLYRSVVKATEGLAGSHLAEIRRYAFAELGVGSLRLAEDAIASGSREEAATSVMIAIDQLRSSVGPAPVADAMSARAHYRLAIALILSGRLHRDRREFEPARAVFAEAMTHGLRCGDRDQSRRVIASALDAAGVLEGMLGCHPEALELHWRAAAAALSSDWAALENVLPGSPPPIRAALIQAAYDAAPSLLIAYGLLNAGCSEGGTGKFRDSYETLTAAKDVASRIAKEDLDGTILNAIDENIETSRRRLGQVERTIGELPEPRSEDSGTQFIAAYNATVALFAAGERKASFAELERLLTVVEPPEYPELAINLRLLWVAQVGRPGRDARGIAERLADAEGVRQNFSVKDPSVIAALSHAWSLNAFESGNPEAGLRHLATCFARAIGGGVRHILPSAWRIGGLILESMKQDDAAVLFRKAGLRERQKWRDEMYRAGRGLSGLGVDADAYGELARQLVRGMRFAEAREILHLEAMAELSGNDHLPFRPGRTPSLTGAEEAALVIWDQLGHESAEERRLGWIRAAVGFSDDRRGDPMPGRLMTERWQRIGRKAAGSPARALVAYLPGETSLSIALTVDGKMTVTQIRATSFEISELMFPFLESVRTVADGVNVPARALYDILIAPIRVQLDAAGVRELVIEPGPVTTAVPFAALHSGARWLIEDFALSLAPVSELTDMRRSPRAPPILTILSNRHGARASVLDDVSDEAAAITSIADGAHCEVSVSQDVGATFEALRIAVERGSSILHLAMHAKVDAADPERSTIELWGSVRASRLRELNLSEVDLVVLSACETAVPSGPSRTPRGIDAIVLQAGAHSVIASLYRVDSAATARLMAALYRTLLSPDGRDKALALQSAQCSMIRGAEVDFRHPAYWSAFVLTGNTSGFRQGSSAVPR